jgi:hypothetical protein
MHTLGGLSYSGLLLILDRWQLRSLMLKLLIEELLGHRLYWHAAIKSSYLLIEVAILHFKELDFAFQIEDNLFFCIHLKHWLILDIHSPRCIIKCRDCFINIRL